MKSNIRRVAVVLGAVAAMTAGTVTSQSPANRDFEAEIGKALASAKTAAGFEFLGTLVRTCLVPQSGGENTSDTCRRSTSPNPAKRTAACRLVHRARQGL